MENKNNVVAEQCYECNACLVSCPTNAITIERNDLGMGYAKIEKSKCIGCGICKKICPCYNENVKVLPMKSYAAVSKNTQAIKSTSGGVFLELALEILKEGGVVIGAAYDQNWNVKQTAVYQEKDICKLQGSKYVKSDVVDSYEVTYKLLKQNRKVLYSGTPCQIGGLQMYIKESKLKMNLFTVDIICHGTPTNSFFKSYLELIEKKKNKKIIDFSFRSKEYGHRHIGTYTLTNGRKQKETPLYSSESSYYSFFLQSLTYNEICYSCKYACKERVGDITLGDFWGVRDEIPLFFENNNLSEDNSVSAVMINTKNGEKLFNKVKNKLIVVEANYEMITNHNPRLNRPSSCDKNTRRILLDIYKTSGYFAVEKFFKRNSGFKKYLLRISCHIPSIMKKWLRRVLR